MLLFEYTTERLRSRLYEICADLMSEPPALELLVQIRQSLAILPEFPGTLHAVEWLCHAIDLTCANGRELDMVGREFRAWLEPLASLRIRTPYASEHCTPAEWSQLHDADCPHEPGKRCPFGNSYCVNRIGAPCDHIGAALRIMSWLYRDAANATESEWEIAKSRCRRFARRHLKGWVGKVALAMSERTCTQLYVAAFTLLEDLSGSE
ncbi:MAG: hypothetical protein M5U26_12940 [Planctomycetota bacterium]|nr:hypothetical protein [Planctomycetota bacterium]